MIRHATIWRDKQIVKKKKFMSLKV